MRRLAVASVVVGALGVAACGDDAPLAATPPVTTPVTTPSATTAAPPVAPPTAAPASAQSTAATTEPSTTVMRTTTTTEPRPEVPEGVFVATITQNRPDVSANRFQVKLVNGTDARYRVATVQLVWDGITTERVVRDPMTVVVAGQRVDIPVPFPGATCAGDGTRATMPPFDAARVVLELDDRSTLELPVIDEWFVARRLYEEDCERQMIESLVAIEWVGLQEAEYEGRPVTVADLQVTRREGVGEFTILDISHTIPYFVDPVGGRAPVLTLPADADTAAAPVRFLESRCDPHALAEITQPTKFVAQVQLPDGSVHPYIVFPERDYWPVMRETADRACVELGLVVQLGES